MRVLVTGANGFLGAAVARALYKAGHEVVAAYRPGADARQLAGVLVERRESALLTDEDAARALAGCSALCHVAGAAGRFYQEEEEYERANVELSARLFRAAREAGIRRGVYTGTIAIPSLGRNAYAVSKLRGAYAARREGGPLMEVVVVHPSGMIGAGDTKPTPLGKAILELAAGKLPAILGGGSGFIDVEDAARGHVAALERGDARRDYVLSAEYLTTRELFGFLAAELGVRRPFEIPGAIAALSVAALEPLGRAFSFEPPITRFSQEYLSIPRGRVPDGAEDCAALGLRYRPVREAFRDAISWFRAEGYLRA